MVISGSSHPVSKRRAAMPHSRASYPVSSDASNLTAHRGPNLTECSPPAQQLLCQAPVFLLLTESLPVLPHLLTTYSSLRLKHHFSTMSALFLPKDFPVWPSPLLSTCPVLLSTPPHLAAVLCYSVLLRNLSQLLSSTRLSLNRYYPEMKKKMPHVGHVI